MTDDGPMVGITMKDIFKHAAKNFASGAAKGWRKGSGGWFSRMRWKTALWHGIKEAAKNAGKDVLEYLEEIGKDGLENLEKKYKKFKWLNSFLNQIKLIIFIISIRWRMWMARSAR